MSGEIKQLRELHRARRALLSATEQTANALALKYQIECRDEYQAASHIAAYIAIRGEIDLAPLLECGFACGKHFYLPVLRDEQMFFAPWTADKPLQKKAFGLLEPDVDPASYIAAMQLDLVLVPLVVFDQQCNRIGQGGGFYDRTFSYKNQSHNSGRSTKTKPILIGVAHESQRELQLQPQSWDIALDLIVTNSHTYIQP